MSGIDLGAKTYRIIIGSEGRARFEIHCMLTGTVQVYPRHSILFLSYKEENSILLTLINGTTVSIYLPTKPNTSELDVRSSPKLKKLYSELSDLLS
jgi:hypothetical protein